MQAKSRRFQYWGYLLLGALAFATFYFVTNMGQQVILKAVLGEPADLITKAMSSARISPRITNRTGEIATRKFKVQKFNTTKDSLGFRLFLDGERADATVRLWMARSPSGGWRIVRSDTTFSQ